MPKASISIRLAALIIFFAATLSQAAQTVPLSGVVHDSAGAVVAGADVQIVSAQQAVVAAAVTDAQGRFTLSRIPPGSYVLIVRTEGFEEHREAVNIRDASPESLIVTIAPRAISEQVTVTAATGLAEQVEKVSQQVNVLTREQVEERVKSSIAQIANEEVGIHLQRTSPTMSGIFVRGLTGNKVNVFVDGVRYSTSAARGGVNTFLNLIEPSNLGSVEVLRGPNSAQYGSDAIGGSVQFLSLIPAYSPNGSNIHGRSSTFFNSAEMSFGTSLTTSFATPTFGLLANLAGRRINTLRPGKGRDSHNAVTRFFGLSSDLVIDDRLPDTAFTQYGGMIKLNWTPAPDQQVVANYTRGQQDGGRRYDQLLGGDGNLIADLRNLMLDLFYVKYDKIKMGWLDNLTAIYSFNSQREERVNQGGNGNPLASINHEYERTNAHGAQLYANKQLTASQNLLLGVEAYHERIDSPSFSFNPVTNQSRLRRGRVPDNARYVSAGVYAQDIFDVIPQRLRLTGNIRYGGASYRARTEDSPLVGGERLWPSDSMRVFNFSFRAGAVVTPVEGLSLVANFSRGFRAPHLTDLDTLGLTGSGFEVSAPEVAGLGATVGSRADRNAVSTGRAVEQVQSELSLNYEAGVRYNNRRFDTELIVFVNDVDDLITKQALILPQGAVGLEIGGQTITSQNENGAVFVDVATTPVLVRANFDDARIFGIEHEFEAEVTRSLVLETIFTYLRARDKRTGLPPNVEGGTPAPDGYIKLRYTPARGRFWIEPYIHAADRQERLSTLDLEDRRTGATRSRTSIRNFFSNGARARGLVSAGADGAFATADDFLIATGETLEQIQNRVLGPNVEAAPLYRAVPGYVTFNLRGGVKLGERHEVILEFENITDRNYRGISWGIDAPGRGLFVRINNRF